MILFIEPYVSPQDVEKVFAKSGLDRYVVTLDRNSRCPRSASSCAATAA